MSSTPLEVRLPETPEEQVTYLQALVEALGTKSYTLYDRVLDGFDAIGADTWASVQALIASLRGKQGTEGESKTLTASQVYWMAGLAVYVHLIGKLTAEDAYAKACDALYKPGKEAALKDLEPIVKAAMGETPIEDLDALGAASRTKRDADAKLRAMREAATVMTAAKLFPELDKFCHVYGRETVLAHMGITLVSTETE